MIGYAKGSKTVNFVLTGLVILAIATVYYVHIQEPTPQLTAIPPARTWDVQSVTRTSCDQPGNQKLTETHERNQVSLMKTPHLKRTGKIKMVHGSTSANSDDQTKHKTSTLVSAGPISRVYPSPPRTKYCDVHDYNTPYNTSDRREFDCVRSFTSPHTVQICLYPTQMDVFVSGSIRSKGVWERPINLAILHALDRYKNASFIDIGANLGMHSLVAAKSGRNVIAVEPKLSTIKRLQKSIKLNQLTDKITLVKNGILNERSTLTLYSDDRNQGGSSMRTVLAHTEEIKTILMDDLLEVFHEKEAVIKMDIEASEARALANSTQFFSQVQVHTIFMEWMNLKRYLGGVKPSKDKTFILNMVKTLRTLGFEPRAIDQAFKFEHKPPLFDNSMRTWPGDIVWIKPWPGLPKGKPNQGQNTRKVQH